MEDGSDLVYWYIKFNIPLLGSSVSNKTMRVTDTEGYIMRTDISYDPDKNLIIISPIDTYEQDVFYILSISKKVCSTKGKKLRSEINILFKLLNNEISEYKVLKENVSIPKPKKRDKAYYQTKLYENDRINPNKPTVSLSPLNINVLIGVFGLIFMAVAVYMGNREFVIVSIVVSIIGIAHIIAQLLNGKKRSAILYNLGAIAFNKEKYSLAQKYFNKAFKLDDENELFEYAMEKIKLYNP
jgi:tetratricopeptide (TPR) repeat protein